MRKTTNILWLRNITLKKRYFGTFWDAFEKTIYYLNKLFISFSLVVAVFIYKYEHPLFEIDVTETFLISASINWNIYNCKLYIYKMRYCSTCKR